MNRIPLAEWLLQHPPALITLGVIVLVALYFWWSAPVTWKDGEGSMIEQGENIHGWYDFLRRLRFWS
jgi:hypothetical protein